MRAFAASASMRGVYARLFPVQPMSKRPRSSAKEITMWGRWYAVEAAPCVGGAAGGCGFAVGTFVGTRVGSRVGSREGRDVVGVLVVGSFVGNLEGEEVGVVGACDSVGAPRWCLVGAVGCDLGAG